MNNLTKRTLSGAAFVVVTLGALFAGKLTTFLLFLFFALATQREFYHLVWTPAQRSRKLIVAGLLAGGIFYFVVLIQSLILLSPSSFFSPFDVSLQITPPVENRGWYFLSFLKRGLSLCFFLLFFIGGWLTLRSKNESPFADWGKLILGFLYVSLPFAFVPYLLRHQTSYLLFPLLITWVNDTGAYCVGSLFGKHKLIPSVSPGKSVEGFIGGLFFSMLFGVAFFAFFKLGDLSCPFTYLRGAFLGLVLGLVAVLGDLVESRLKRSLGVKDSGRFLPGHGGFLDRFDSLLFTLPAAALLYSFL